MKIEEVNTSNLDKYLEGYPENVKTALKKTYLCFAKDACKHIVKYYKIGYFGIPDGLQRWEEIKICPQSQILKKYYPEIGNASITFSVHEMTGRISPAYYDYDTNEFHSFTEDMMGNNAMWNEMAEVKLTDPTIEYAEELSLDAQYAEWKQQQSISDFNKLKSKETITYKLPMVALVVSLVSLIINLIVKFAL